MFAYFGCPRAYEDQAKHAIQASFDAVVVVEHVDVSEVDTLKVHVSIATSQVVVVV